MNTFHYFFSHQQETALRHKKMVKKAWYLAALKRVHEKYKRTPMRHINIGHWKYLFLLYFSGGMRLECDLCGFEKASWIFLTMVSPGLTPSFSRSRIWWSLSSPSSLSLSEKFTDALCLQIMYVPPPFLPLAVSLTEYTFLGV